MSVLLGILTLVALFFAYRYFSLRHALKKLRQDIQKKRGTQTNLLLTSQKKDLELESVIHELNEVFHELQQIQILNQREKQTLDLAIHNITHDIRTPLTIASGYTQQLIKKEPDQPTLQKIQKNLKTVSQRLEILMEYQNLLENNVQPDFAPVNLSQVLTEELLKYYQTLTTQQFTVTTDLAENIWIENDREILARIFQNLFGNVIKHGKSALIVRLAADSQQAIITIQNQSRQPIEKLDKLTTRFYSENMSETEKSSGLGLYITKELVELTRGSLTMTYEEPDFSVKISWLKTASNSR